MSFLFLNPILSFENIFYITIENATVFIIRVRAGCFTLVRSRLYKYICIYYIGIRLSSLYNLWYCTTTLFLHNNFNNNIKYQIRIDLVIIM